MFKAPRLFRLLQLQNEGDAKVFGELKDKEEIGSHSVRRQKVRTYLET